LKNNIIAAIVMVILLIIFTPNFVKENITNNNFIVYLFVLYFIITFVYFINYKIFVKNTKKNK